MVAELMSTYAVTAAAMITASAAVYTANAARTVLEKVQDNEERSRINRRILTGDAEHVEGVLPRLEELEERKE